MTTATTDRTPKCAHGVAIFLDKDHSCFECEKHFLALGMPIQMRLVDEANTRLILEYQRAAQPAPAPEAATPKWTEAGLGRLKAALEADLKKSTEAVENLALTGWYRDLYGNRKPATALDINGDLDTVGTTTDTEQCPHEAALASTEAELKALQRLFIAQRDELAQAIADRDAFARENFDYVRRLDILRGKLRQINVVVNCDTPEV
jgi:hypothetical protein